MLRGDQRRAGPGGSDRPGRVRAGYGPGLLARAAWLVCAQHLPVRRAGAVLGALVSAQVSTGWVGSVRGRAARLLEAMFLPRVRVRVLVAAAPVAHADETTASAEGALRYLHVACTDYLTVMHVGDRSAATIDAGEVWPAFTGVLVRDGYAHLTGALHAWCGAHLLRDLRSVHEGDLAGQVRADAMATTLLEAHHAARAAREAGQTALAPEVRGQVQNHYLGALARGETDNHGKRSPLSADARALIRRFRRYEDMILRFATDLTVPFSNNLAERDVRPVKVQQRVSGGCWRTLTGLADFAIVQSYLSTATKRGSIPSTRSPDCSPPARGYPRSPTRLTTPHRPADRGAPPHLRRRPLQPAQTQEERLSPELNSYLVSTGDPSGAIPHFQAAIDRIGTELPRDRLGFLLNLAMAHIQAGDPDAAISIAREAITSTAVPSSIMAGRISEVHRAITAAGHPGAPDLAEHARRVAGTAGL